MPLTPTLSHQGRGRIRKRIYIMKIDCYFSMDCRSDELLRKNVPEALAAEGIDADINYHRIDDHEATRMGLKGSPTILIDGADPFPSEISGFS
jgi:hypothetical protein